MVLTLWHQYSISEIHSLLEKIWSFTVLTPRHWLRWFRAVAEALLTPLPKASSYPLEVFLMPFLPCLARLDGAGVHPLSPPSGGVWRQQASTGGTSIGTGTGSQWNKLPAWVTSWPRAPGEEWDTWDFSEHSFTPRGDYCSVPHNLRVNKGPGSNQDTYLLQLPAVSFSRRTLFIFCINYSASWAGQETGKEEGKKADFI